MYISPWKLWSLALVVAVIVTTLASNGHYPPLDVTISRAVQEAKSPSLEPLSQSFYHFGASPVSLTAALILSAMVGLRLGVTPAAFLLLSVCARPLGTLIKEIVERPRPSELSLQFVENASGYSFPSGHVFGTVLFIGFLWFLVYQSTASQALRLASTAGTGLFLLLMGLQRVYAGAHWPSDVLGAYLWGGLVLFLIVQLYSRRWAVAVTDFQQAPQRTQHQEPRLRTGQGVGGR